MDVHDGLERYRAGTPAVGPARAGERETSADGTEYTFALREDLTCHAGSAFDAQAARLACERMLN
jgi:peptide/nickel transport system substrate-binding protein